MIRRRSIPLLVAAWIAWGSPLPAAQLARDGQPTATICLPDRPSPQERTAAEELRVHLEAIVGSSFEESCVEIPAKTVIHVGATAGTFRVGWDPRSMTEEQWRIDRRPRQIYLHGGGLRGTLYAVWHFLEQDLGVRWWNPWESWIPRSADLRVGRGRRSGRPAFAYRDIHGVADAHPYAVRNRLNGHFSRADWAHGWKEAYGPPYHVHTFFLYTPPEQYFEQHPEFFSEVAGLRFGGESQLCMSEDGVVEQVLERLDGFVAQAEANREPDAPTPTLYGLSQNDWGRPCGCDRCTALAVREGSASGPLLHFVNRVARQAAKRHPGIRIDTLAYGYGADPPAGIRPDENVVVRFAGLYGRDFARAAEHPRNGDYRRRLEGWSEIAPTLRVWDYANTYGDAGDPPLPVLRRLSEDLRLYERLGIDGVFLQHEDPVSADLWDLKSWVLMHLLENPGLDPDRLIREFAWGYYGAAAPTILGYIDWTRRRSRQAPAVDFAPEAEVWSQYDRRALVQAHRWFDQGLERVQAQPLIAERLRHARVALDRLTLHRLPHLESTEGLPGPEELEKRILEVARSRILQRLPSQQQNEAWKALRAELHGLLR